MGKIQITKTQLCCPLTIAVAPNKFTFFRGYKLLQLPTTDTSVKARQRQYKFPEIR